jgi:hypothetical protein
VPPRPHLKSFTPTKSNLYFAVSLAGVVSEPDVYRLSIFHTCRVKLVLVPFRVAGTGEKRNAYRILVGITGGKKPLGRPGSRWMNIIKMDLREIGWDCMDWIDLAQDRDQWRALVNAVMNLRFP